MDTTNNCQLPQIIHNGFRIIHLYNKSQQYHLTKAVLLDCVKKEEQCFFSNIILLKKVLQNFKLVKCFAILFLKVCQSKSFEPHY